MKRRFITLKDVVDFIYAHTRPEGGCLVSTRPRRLRDGYAQQHFDGRMHYAHQLVARYYLGPCPEGQEVRHLCGRGAEGCVTASHLRYGTHAENGMDSRRKNAAVLKAVVQRAISRWRAGG